MPANSPEAKETLSSRSWREQFRRWRESPPPDSAPETPETAFEPLIQSAAEWVVKRRLETPAVLFLEAHKPMSFLASQSLLVGMPLLAPLFGLQRTEQFSELLKKSENVDRLIERIEILAEAR